ncbi:hypothetical protein F5B21DRAFT_519402 [Xylaria acuta]|nr:hypothetical protein F5B21DRAFT_519402 [Xylaria acuta]
MAEMDVLQKPPFESLCPSPASVLPRPINRCASPPTPSNVTFRHVPYTTGPTHKDRNSANKPISEQPTFNKPSAAIAALANIADGKVAQPTPGLVKFLLEYSVEVCFERRKCSNILKIIRNKDLAGVRSNLLERATRNCSYDILLLLAQNANGEALGQALPIAVAQNDLKKTRILLARGANATPLCSQFLVAVEFGSDKMVSELTR